MSIVAVTGPTGHLGVNLVKLLLAAGHQVNCLINDDGSKLDAFRDHPGLQCFVGDVLQPTSMEPAFMGAEIVFHLAAIISIDGDPTGLVRRVNVEGARNVAIAAKTAGARRLLHVSSIHAFDPLPLSEPLTEARPRVSALHHPAYDRSKAAGEEAVRSQMNEAFDVVVVHPSGAIGPVDPWPSLMGKTVLELFRGEAIGTIAAKFDWVDVRDIARGMVAASEKGRRGESYILSGHVASFKEIGALCAEISGSRTPKFAVPLRALEWVAPLSALIARRRKTTARLTPEALRALRLCPTIELKKSRAELGYSPRPLRETLADLYAFFERTGALGR